MSNIIPFKTLRYLRTDKGVELTPDVSQVYRYMDLFERLVASRGKPERKNIIKEVVALTAEIGKEHAKNNSAA